MRVRRLGWIAWMFVAAVQLAGCAGTVDGLKQHGVEFHSGKVVRVFRF